MNTQNTTIDKSELRQIADILTMIQALPLIERVAAQYYIKGRIDAGTANIEIPLTTAARETT